MTEDDAFIRAIVDHPGDDTPRLVYADWLDDRDDRRGAYLRAEAEWARPWQSGKGSDYNPVLLVQASELDPIWVARVSRPPIGVCCDHLVFRDGGTQLEDISDAIHSMRELKFPDEYIAFLLNQNGGSPFLRAFAARLPRDRGWIDVNRFYSFRPGTPNLGEPEAHTIGRPYFGGNPPLRLLSIASRYDDLHGVSLVLSKEGYGGVVFDETHYYHGDSDDQYTVLEQAWRSMPVFLAEISPPSEPQREGPPRTLEDFDDSNLYCF